MSNSTDDSNWMLRSRQTPAMTHLAGFSFALRLKVHMLTHAYGKNGTASDRKLGGAWEWGYLGSVQARVCTRTLSSLWWAESFSNYQKAFLLCVILYALRSRSFKCHGLQPSTTYYGTALSWCPVVSSQCKLVGMKYLHDDVITLESFGSCNFPHWTPALYAASIETNFTWV